MRACLHLETELYFRCYSFGSVELGCWCVATVHGTETETRCLVQPQTSPVWAEADRACVPCFASESWVGLRIRHGRRRRDVSAGGSLEKARRSLDQRRAQLCQVRLLMAVEHDRTRNADSSRPHVAPGQSLSGREGREGCSHRSTPTIGEVRTVLI